MTRPSTLPPSTSRPAIPDDQLDALVTVLDLIRGGTATRPEISRLSGLGRTVVTQRVGQLLAAGLVDEQALAPSTGGRPARELRFRAEAGHILVAELGATGLAVALSDLTGGLTHIHEEPADIAAGPEAVLGRIEELFDKILDSHGRTVWGIGIGLPGPVEYAVGHPIAPPIMPGWDDYPVRERLGRRYRAPAWIDNEVNLMTLGEVRGGLARGHQDVVFLKIGTGIGAGLVSHGHLHRGAQGVAGDVGHMAITEDPQVVCRCGNIGCLEAVAGGAALARQATAAGHDGRSPFLAGRIATKTDLEVADLAEAVTHGDAWAVELVSTAGRRIGSTLAGLVNFYNPSLILIGGRVSGIGDQFLAAVREAIYRRSLPLATRDLQVARAQLGDRAGLHGAAFMVIDELFSRPRLPRWLGLTSPAGRPEVADPIPSDAR